MVDHQNFSFRGTRVVYFSWQMVVSHRLPAKIYGQIGGGGLVIMAQQTLTLQDLSNQLGRVEKLAAISAKAILDLDEAVLFTGFSKGHLYRLTSERQIPHYKKSRKLYFRKSELEAWLLEEKVLTNAELDSRAATYMATHK